jgi:pimeloyl-ACP methyl ester carboxylesterase
VSTAEERTRLSWSARLGAGLLALGTLASCATPMAPGHIDVRVVGSGKPVVVFQSGLGDGLAVWAAVQDKVAERAAAVAFSRPGYGRSPADAGERSPCAAAATQRDMLRRAGLAPPYVLVGHSLGGLYQFAYARLFPDEVAGIVLLEPTHPQHWSRLQQDAPVVALLIRTARLSAFTSTMRREFDEQERCLGELAAKPTPAVPIRILVRGRFVPPETGAFERVMRELWLDWSRLLGGRPVDPVPDAGHYLQKDQPQAVANAVNAVLDARAPDPAATATARRASR